MKALYIIRHAKAREKQGGQKDMDRELDSTGLQNSSRMGRNFYEKDIFPNLIVSSTAIRAMTTASLISEQVNYDVNRIEENPNLYEAPVRVLLQAVNGFSDEYEKIFLVGHNPGLSYLAEYITGENVGSLTTCGVVKCLLEVNSWSEVSAGNCKLDFYIYPDLLNF